MRHAAHAVAVALVVLAGIGVDATVTVANAAPTTSAVPALTARVVFPRASMRSGARMRGLVVVDNHTGAPVPFTGCGSPFQVVLGNAHVQQGVAWASCAQREQVPAGRTRYVVELDARWSSCQGSPAGPATGPPCDADDMPPGLPPGRYRATLAQNPTLVAPPSPVTIRVTPAKG